MDNVRRQLIQQLISPDVPRWKRQEEWLAAKITADQIIKKFGQLVTAENAGEFASLI